MAAMARQMTGTLPTMTVTVVVMTTTAMTTMAAAVMVVADDGVGIIKIYMLKLVTLFFPPAQCSKPT